MRTNLKEETNTTSIPSEPSCLPCGTPVFRVSDEIFFNLHLKQRETKQWYDKHYKDTDVADYARKNRGKDFYLKHESNDIYRKIKAT